MAKLYFRYGAMGSGKSIDLLKVAHNYEQRGHKVFLMTADIDSRSEKSSIETRIGLKRKAEVFSKESNVYSIIEENAADVACILVDEAQFLMQNQVDQLSDVVDYLNIPVICYGLRTDFATTTFTGSDRLLEVADKIEEIKTICTCGKKAIYNARYVDGKIVTKGEQIFIGDLEYKSICRKCYKEQVAKENVKNKKAYSLIVGRFEPIHKGHEKLVQIGLDKNNAVVMYVTENKKDSIDTQKRMDLIKQLYKQEIEQKRVIVKKYINPEDINISYGNSVFKNFENEFGQKPDTLIYGTDKNLDKCFSKSDLENVEIVPVKRDGINATQIRESLKNNTFHKVESNINEKIVKEVKLINFK